MTEIKVLVDKKELRYEGPFRLEEFHGTLMRFFKERHFVQVELRSEEKQHSDGKYFFAEMFPYRKMSDYLRKAFHLEIFMYRLNKKEVVVNGKKETYDFGEIRMLFTVTMFSDWRFRFEKTGFYFFLRALIDKYIRYDIIREMEDEIMKDYIDLQEELKNYLQMTRMKIIEPGVEQARIREAV
ncbi:MAG: hypothetical protein OXR66_05865 [Candidatus Woesearchaeota archaeon]|nr:hypothetical protein [Candidatus Woesearchaeota archaeon]